MAEQVEEARDEHDERDDKSDLDERKIARVLSVTLPLATLALAAVLGAIVGPAMAILALAAGLLLGVIALFWASLRVLSGDAPIAPELEALDASAHAVDALAVRKKMLLRAIKDLDVEHQLGKLDDDDRDQLARTYRAELKEVLRRIDETLAPHRDKAEEMARAHLARVGLEASGVRTDADATRADAADAAPEAVSEPKVASEKVPADAISAARVACAKCATKNDPDAAFCKKCGASLAGTPAAGAETKEHVE